MCSTFSRSVYYVAVISIVGRVFNNVASPMFLHRRRPWRVTRASAFPGTWDSARVKASERFASRSRYTVASYDKGKRDTCHDSLSLSLSLCNFNSVRSRDLTNIADPVKYLSRG